MRTLIDFMAVEVEKRDADGNLEVFFPHGVRPTAEEAEADAIRLAKMYPNKTYVVVERWITEVERTEHSGLTTKARAIKTDTQA